MTKTRQTFTEEFKREAVGLLEGSGRPLMQVAAEPGIHPSMLRSWRAAAHGTASPHGYCDDPARAVAGRAGGRDRTPQVPWSTARDRNATS